MGKTVKMYKLVSQDMTTHGGMKWEIGKKNVATGVGTAMCTNQVLHCYATPEQAALFNPIHANIQNPILLEIECAEIVNTDGLKYASKEQTPLRKLKLPSFTTKQRIAFAIKAALLVYKAASFVKWAKAWLDGTDRSADAAYAAYAAYATYASADAARASADATARAARAAADAAADAAYAAYVTYASADAARASADATARAAYASADAARATADATARAAYASADLKIFGKQLQEVIDWVINEFKE